MSSFLLEALCAKFIILVACIKIGYLDNGMLVMWVEFEVSMTVSSRKNVTLYIWYIYVEVANSTNVWTGCTPS